MIDANLLIECLEPEEATEPFCLEASWPSKSNPLTEPVTLDDFNKPQKPITLGHYDIYGFLESINFAEHDVTACVPVNPTLRHFWLPSEMVPFSGVVKHGIQLLETFLNLENVIAIQFSSCCEIVQWNKTLHVGAWHMDSDMEYNAASNTYDSETYDYVRLGCAYPTATQFLTSVMPRDVALARAKREIYKAESNYEPPINCFYAWGIQHPHCSPRVPGSKEETIEMLTQMVPDFPAHIVQEKGMLRILADFHVECRRPGLQNEAIKTPRPGNP